jgi:uncharacterized membrane protein
MPSSPSARRRRASLSSARPALAAARTLAALPALATTVFAAAALSAAALAATGCGTDTDPDCDRSFLRYDNFGSPFITNWCRACHSAQLPPDMRQKAPVGINFDSLHEIRIWSLQIKVTAGDTDAMPPAGGPSPAERQMLVEWLGCGAP